MFSSLQSKKNDICPGQLVKSLVLFPVYLQNFYTSLASVHQIPQQVDFMHLVRCVLSMKCHKTTYRFRIIGDILIQLIVMVLVVLL